MMTVAHRTIGLALTIAMASSIPSGLVADPAPSSATAIEIPITQTLMRDGTIRYGVWLSVGTRFVEAMLDTGSTGLRVLPAVMPGDLIGLPTEADYLNNVSLKGLVIATRVEIGSLHATIPIEVVDHVGCHVSQTTCPVPKRGDEFLIGGDGASGHGYSAILGIGFSSRSPDIPNPLQSLGIGQWMVELPRPEEPDAAGRLILKPDIALQGQFKMGPVQKHGDFFGCIKSKTPEQNLCAPVILDSGAPGIIAVIEEGDTTTKWTPGIASTFRFPGNLTLAFTSTPESTKTTNVQVFSAKQSPVGESPFILAGLYPYYFYDVLYDAVNNKVGLKPRDPVSPKAVMASTDAPAFNSDAAGDDRSTQQSAPAKKRSTAKRRENGYQ